ncbi:unnamed protein product, partial [Arabidopsis halleri]
SHINGSISGFKCSASLTSLDLSRNSLSGPVTTLTGLDVSRCVNLKFLHVSSNNFSIGIPFIGDCSALQHLDISGNKLSGTVPPSFSSCSLLESLLLSSNNFSGKLSMDTLLKMRGLKFSGELPESLMNLSASLLTLDLSSNNFSGPIFPNICRNPKNTLQEQWLHREDPTGH